jgi:hypothetical protein
VHLRSTLPQSCTARPQFQSISHIVFFFLTSFFQYLTLISPTCRHVTSCLITHPCLFLYNLCFRTLSSVFVPEALKMRGSDTNSLPIMHYFYYFIQLNDGSACTFLFKSIEFLLNLELMAFN